MIHLMLDHGERIDEIMFFETGWDFPQIEAHIQQVEKNTGIKAVRIRNYRHFNELLRRYGWPHPSGGWCVARKGDTCNRFVRAIRGTVECIGFNADERERTKRPWLQKKKWEVRYPLIEAKMTRNDALSYCYSLGYDWGGLYDVFNRVSCFCCPKAGQKRIDKLKTYFPPLYEKYLKMNKIAQSSSA